LSANNEKPEGSQLRATSKFLDGLPQLKTYKNVLYVPAERARKVTDSRLRYIGGLLDSEGDAITEGFLHRAGERFSKVPAQTPAQRIKKPALYLGWLFSAYGHVLLESLARLWAAKDVEASFYVFHSPQVATPPSFFLEFLKRVGIPEKKVIIPNQATTFAQLHVPEAAAALKQYTYRDATAQIYRSIAGPSKERNERPLYISRSRLEWHRRLTAGEDVLENLLAQNGFDVIYPETLPISEQITLFRDRVHFVGPEGSAMHNILFNAGRPHVVCFTAGQPNDNFLFCDAISGADTLYVQACDTGGYPDFGRQTPLRLDIAAAVGALQREGLLGEIDLTGYQAEIDRRHRELWAEVRIQLGIMRNQPRAALDDVFKHCGYIATPRVNELLRRAHSETTETADDAESSANYSASDESVSRIDLNDEEYDGE
jgi:capsular polysaccharide biosynthesis protein